MSPKVSVITVTLNRPSLKDSCASVDRQTFHDWHHYVIGDGVPPEDYRHPQRTSFGFSRSLGAEEPGLNMPNGTPNPLQRWALRHLDLAEYVCFLDDDNVYEPSFLEQMVRHLHHEPDYGLVLCKVMDLRYGQEIDGYPLLGRCDNSGFLARSSAAKAVPFPAANPDKEVKQDWEFIRLLGDRFGWTRIDDCLVQFGAAPDIPPARGRSTLITSWERPLKAAARMRSGDLSGGIDDLESIVAEYPADGWARWQLAEAYLMQGRSRDAKETWRTWLRLAPPEAFRHDWLILSRCVARMATDDENWQEGLEMALRLVEERMTGDGESLMSHGLYRLLAGDVEGALVDLERSRTLPQRVGNEQDIKDMLALLARLSPHLAGVSAARALLETPGNKGDTIRYRVFLSPHFDDAVGSCGGLISRLTSEGVAVHVVTVFGGDEVEPFSDFARALHREWELERVVHARRIEDEHALQVVEAQGRVLNFTDSIYRTAADGTLLYPTGEALFGEPAKPDMALPKAIADAVAEVFPASETLVIAPRGIGGHVDHRLVNRAARQLMFQGYRMLFYRDFTYEAGSEIMRDVPALRHREFPLTEAELAAKEAAITCYRSQIDCLFGGMASLKTYLEAVGNIEVLSECVDSLEDTFDQLFSAEKKV